MLAHRSERGRFSHAFTLIELLIVVAIIAILAAIAVPNFLEAQVRAKASRARADMRTMATALEAYAVDCNRYPQAEINGTLRYLFQISTPVAYLSEAHIPDPFTPDHYVDITRVATLRYYGFNGEGVMNADHDTGVLFSPRDDPERMRIEWYLLFCHGPDGVRNNLEGGAVEGTLVRNDNIRDTARFVHFLYDPTNGTTSDGEILRGGGSPVGATAAAARLTWSR